MSQGPQYTSCIAAGDFSKPNAALVATLGVLVAAGGITAIFTAGIGALVSIAALVQLLRYVLDWMLNRKLICLHRNSKDCNCGEPGSSMVCAIGEVADTEDIGEDKNFIADVDNDYAMNVVLAPFDMRAFAANNAGTSTADIPDALRDKNHAIAAAPGQPQGDLLHRELPPPLTRVKDPLGEDLVGGGYFRTMIGLDDGTYHAWSEIVGRDYSWFGIVGPDQKQRWSDYVFTPENARLHPVRFPVPVLHCEFEGNRIKRVLDAIELFSFGGKWCKSNWFTRALCTILQTIFAPLALIAAGIAWATATDGDDATAVQGGGHVSAKEWVVASGRWTYDGGHSGWSELHATRVVQKIDKRHVPMDVTAFRDYLHRWCESLAEVPRGEPPTPKQQAVTNNLNSPEYGWVLHPQIDGCEPEEEDHPPDGPRLH